MNRNSLLAVLSGLAGIFFLAFGFWAFLDSQSFFEEVATFEPYNAHLLHDIGAFQIGIGATLLLALWQRTDAIFTALGGAGIDATFHVLAHIGDRDLGGSDSDIVILAVVAVLLLAGAAWKLASDPRI